MYDIDELGFRVEYLSQDLGLIKPNHENSIAGILPEIINHWDTDITPSSHCSTFRRLSDRIEEVYPGGYTTVILFLVDGLGSQDLSKLGGYLSDQARQGGITATSVYPTMTSTVMTSLMYGTQPSYHGVVGYNIYNEYLNRVWNALKLQYLDANQEICVVTDEYDLSHFVTGQSLTQTMTKSGITVTYFVPDYLRPPGLGTLLNPSFPQQGYANHQDVISQVKFLLKTSQDLQFIVVYFPEIDAAGHQFGPDSIEYGHSLRSVERAVQQLMALPELDIENTLCLLTSDHGLATIDRNQVNLMTKNRWQSVRDQGTLLAYSGRNIHAYAIDGDLQATYELLQTMTDPNHSMIITKEEAIDLSGGDGRHHLRIGDFNVLCANNYMLHVPNCLSVENEIIDLGHHGSLSPGELFVPAIILS